MAYCLYFYLPIELKTLDSIFEIHKKEFEEFLDDEYSQEEKDSLEAQLDSLAAVFVQPILDELTFDDFYPEKGLEKRQEDFFSKCRSSILFENLPDFESNFLQVIYLKHFLQRFSEVLIDQGGVNSLQFKDSFLNLLNKYRGGAPRIFKNMGHLNVNSPMDQMLEDIYKEVIRLGGQDLGCKLELQSDKVRKLYSLVLEERTSANSLLGKSNMNPKDFGDNLEKLKFFLKRI